MASNKIDQDHIGVFDNYFDKDFCEHYISFYKEMEKNRLVMERETPSHIKDDNNYDIIANII